jgi:probable rRNA maturation factor
MLPSEDKPDPQRTALYNAAFYNVDVTLLGDEEIAALNRDYRHKNKPTDVLSFSLWEGVDGFVCPPDQSEELPLGDLVISIDTALRQAEDLKHSLENEMEFLAVHGTLHLLGYDHIKAAERRVMWRWQEAIIEKLRS